MTVLLFVHFSLSVTLISLSRGVHPGGRIKKILVGQTQSLPPNNSSILRETKTREKMYNIVIWKWHWSFKKTPPFSKLIYIIVLICTSYLSIAGNYTLISHMRLVFSWCFPVNVFSFQILFARNLIQLMVPLRHRKRYTLTCTVFKSIIASCKL